MADLLSYFQFVPSHYSVGQIQYCSLSAQGIYVNIWCFYWQRECVMTKDELFKKYKEHDLLNELIDNGVIKIENNSVIIEFLIEQYEPLRTKYLKLSASGKQGAKKAHENRLKAKGEHIEELPVSQNKSGMFFRIGMRRYDYSVSKYVLDECQITLNEFMPSMKPITVDQVLKIMDSENAGMTFTNDNHVKNTFKKIARNLKAKITTPGFNLGGELKATVSKRPNLDA